MVSILALAQFDPTSVLPCFSISISSTWNRLKPGPFAFLVALIKPLPQFNEPDTLEKSFEREKLYHLSHARDVETQRSSDKVVRNEN